MSVPVQSSFFFKGGAGPRLLKILRGFEAFRLLLSAFKIALEALPVLLFTLAILVLAFSALMYFVEPRDNVPSMAWAAYLVIMTTYTIRHLLVLRLWGAGRLNTPCASGLLLMITC